MPLYSAHPRFCIAPRGLPALEHGKELFMWNHLKRTLFSQNGMMVVNALFPR